MEKYLDLYINLNNPRHIGEGCSDLFYGLFGWKVAAIYLSTGLMIAIVSGWVIGRLGTVLAFMMSVIALSLPEFIILRKVLKPRLIAVVIGVVGVGIMTVGYLFNALPLQKIMETGLGHM